MTKSLFKKEIKRLNRGYYSEYLREYDLALLLLKQARHAMINFVPTLNTGKPGFILFTPTDDATILKGEFVSLATLNQQIQKTKHPGLQRIKERIERFKQTSVYYPFAAQVGKAIISASVAATHSEVEHEPLFQDSSYEFFEGGDSEIIGLTQSLIR